MKLSVIIPVYNAKRYLRDCLNSVIAQTYTDWECVCTDDGSNDGSGDMLDEYAKCDNRFKVIHQKNSGEGAARNAALERISGDYYLFLDADDILCANTLADVVKVLDLNPTAELIGYGIEHFKDHFESRSLDDEMPKICSYEDLKQSLSGRVLSQGVCTLAYSRHKFGGIRFSALKIGADLVYVSKCCQIACSYIAIDKIEYACRVCSDSMSRRERTPDMMVDTIDFRRNVFKNLLDSNKQIPKRYVRSAINQWLEEHSAQLSTKKYNSEWKVIWQYWFKSLEDLARLPWLTPWQRFVTNIIISTKSRLLVKLLCVLPYKLKLLGVHR